MELVFEEFIDFCKRINLAVGRDDVQDLQDSHNQLSIDELLQMREQGIG